MTKEYLICLKKTTSESDYRTSSSYDYETLFFLLNVKEKLYYVYKSFSINDAFHFQKKIFPVDISLFTHEVKKLDSTTTIYYNVEAFRFMMGTIHRGFFLRNEINNLFFNIFPNTFTRKRISNYFINGHKGIFIVRLFKSLGDKSVYKILSYDSIIKRGLIFKETVVLYKVHTLVFRYDIDNQYQGYELSYEFNTEDHDIFQTNYLCLSSREEIFAYKSINEANTKEYFYWKGIQLDFANLVLESFFGFKSLEKELIIQEKARLIRQEKEQEKREFFRLEEEERKNKDENFYNSCPFNIDMDSSGILKDIYNLKSDLKPYDCVIQQLENHSKFINFYVEKSKNYVERLKRCQSQEPLNYRHPRPLPLHTTPIVVSNNFFFTNIDQVYFTEEINPDKFILFETILTSIDAFSSYSHLIQNAESKTTRCIIVDEKVFIGRRCFELGKVAGIYVASDFIPVAASSDYFNIDYQLKKEIYLQNGIDIDKEKFVPLITLRPRRPSGSRDPKDWNIVGIHVLKSIVTNYRPPYKVDFTIWDENQHNFKKNYRELMEKIQRDK